MQLRGLPGGKAEFRQKNGISLPFAVREWVIGSDGVGGKAALGRFPVTPNLHDCNWLSA